MSYHRARIASIVALLAGAITSLAAAPDFKRAAVPFMEKHCYECHGGKHTKGDLDLKAIKDDKQILENFKLWRGVLQQVNSGEMPPKKQLVRPNAEEIETFNQALNNAFASAESRTKPDPGHVTVRRLNRTEYNNTVRDLLGVDFNPAENFPADDIGYGFDNIGDVLTISPVHLERYLDAADGIASRAVMLTLPKPSTHDTYSIFLEPNYHGSEDSTRPVTNSPPELFVRQKFLKGGDFTFQVEAACTNAPDGQPVQMTLIAGDKELATVTVTNVVGKKHWGKFEAKVSLPAGEHRLAARFANPETGTNLTRMLFIRDFKVIGPADTRTDFQKQVADIAPGKPEAERTSAVVDWFLTHAFRRPPTKEEQARYMQVFGVGQADAQGSWEGGLQQVVKTVLCSPKFLFRVELDDRPKTKDSHPLDEYQLASRLSYFLWSTMPDDELLDLAAKKKLTANLDAQVQRMLRDPKAESLVENFALQWLQLQRLRTFAPDTTMFPAFNEGLRRSMLKETELFFGEIVHQDRSVLDLMDADFTYLNEQLARHYGIIDSMGNYSWTKASERRPGGQSIRGPEFVRVSLNNKDRGGLLTQASVLTVTSNPTRTSPVKRGKWVLEQILGTPPPPPPPGVSQLEAQHELKGTLRQRMEQHRANPACAACHQQMDALGFAMENFDAIGHFRAKDGNDPIDPSGTLPDGRTFNGVSELKTVLKDKKVLVARNLTEKLLTYGLGRGLEFYDERAVKKIVADLGKQDYKFSALVIGIVKSDPFSMQRGKQLNQKYDSGE